MKNANILQIFIREYWPSRILYSLFLQAVFEICYLTAKLGSVKLITITFDWSKLIWKTCFYCANCTPLHKLLICWSPSSYTFRGHSKHIHISSVWCPLFSQAYFASNLFTVSPNSCLFSLFIAKLSSSFMGLSQPFFWCTIPIHSVQLQLHMTTIAEVSSC